MKEAGPSFLKTYEKFLTDNGTGWLVGKEVSLLIPPTVLPVQ
jgi:hypothetical protein